MVHANSIRVKVFALMLMAFMALGVSPVFASDNLNTRLYGTDRYQTAAVIAAEFSDQNVDSVVLASGGSYADALSASVLAHKLAAPILLVDKNPQTSQAALQYIQDHLQAQGTVYIIGGQGVISSDFNDYLGNKSYQVKRLAGADRYSTNSLIANEINTTNGSIFVASGENFPDALSIASFASEDNSPILLVKANSLSQQTKDYLQKQQPHTIFIAGGSGVISSTVENQIKAIVPKAEIIRFAGKDRYETAALSYDQFAQAPQKVYVASGLNYPDALSGTVVAAKDCNPILLINPNTPLVPQSIEGYLTQLYQKQIKPSVIALGGAGVVSEEVVNNVVHVLKGEEQVPLFNITAVDSRLIFSLPIIPLPNQNYYFNINTYKKAYPLSSE